jgi:hypothetical protein
MLKHYFGGGKTYTTAQRFESSTIWVEAVIAKLYLKSRDILDALTEFEQISTFFFCTNVS